LRVPSFRVEAHLDERHGIAVLAVETHGGGGFLTNAIPIPPSAGLDFITLAFRHAEDAFRDRYAAVLKEANLLPAEEKEIR